LSTFEIFPIKSLCVIIDVLRELPAKDGKPPLEHVKNALVNGICKLDSDDNVYVYRDDGELKMGFTTAESVGVINDWTCRKVNVLAALEESVCLVSNYPDDHRGVFYLTDNYRSSNDGLFQALLECNRDKDLGCKFYVYGIGPGYHGTLATLGDGLPGYHFRHLDDYSQLDQYFSEDVTNL
jgi:hypothetical protein